MGRQPKGIKVADWRQIGGCGACLVVRVGPMRPKDCQTAKLVLQRFFPLSTFICSFFLSDL